MCFLHQTLKDTPGHDDSISAHLDVQVDLRTSAEVREVPACFEMSSSGVGVQFIHLLLGLQREGTVIKHLRIKTKIKAAV